MTSMQIDEGKIPRLDGQIAVVTVRARHYADFAIMGGASGIGLATTKLLLAKGAVVHVLDRNEPIEAGWQAWPNLHFQTVDVASFASQRAAFAAIGPLHMCFANAAVRETSDFFADTFEADGTTLAEPDQLLFDVNTKGVWITVKLAWSAMRRHHIRGSLVITGSTTGYSPEGVMPTYSALKLSLVGLVRALRHTVGRDGITINAVAPAGTLTPLVAGLLDGLVASGLPITSPPERPALALVYSATATQDRRVDLYGKDADTDLFTKGERWNGRIIYVLGDTFTEIEQPTADLRPFWFGHENTRLVRAQQVITDFR